MAMTLPRLVKDSLREEISGLPPALRFPLDGCQLATASDSSRMIMTYKIGDGFEASFFAKPAACRSLGIALNDSLEHRLKEAVSLSNSSQVGSAAVIFSPPGLPSYDFEYLTL